jgi:hypothetical protein
MRIPLRFFWHAGKREPWHPLGWTISRGLARAISFARPYHTTGALRAFVGFSANKSKDSGG